MAGVSPLRTTEQWEFEIGVRLRQIRLSRNITQESLASSANISVGAVKTLIQVVRALGLEQWLESLQVPNSAFSPIALLREQQARELNQRKRATGAISRSTGSR
jgi:transcriptional regulator with XRE-family HTH domain